MDFLQLLPQHIVFNDIIKLLDVTSRVRAAAVSHSWRDLLRAAPCTGDHLSTLPWLWGASDVRNGKPFLIDLASSTSIGSHHRPSQRDSVLSCRGLYITFADIPLTKPIRICEPFTSETFHLPCTYRDTHGRIHPVGNVYGIQFSSKQPNCVIAAWTCAANTVYLCRPGDSHWVMGLLACNTYDMVFHRGQFYSFEPTPTRIKAYDFTYMVDFLNGRTPFTPTPPSRLIALAADTFEVRSLLESGGDVWLVARYDWYYQKKVMFIVYKVDEDKGTLVRVADLGDGMVFLGSGCSVMTEFGAGPTTTSDSFFTRNSIYFFNPIEDYHRLGKFQLERETCQYHPGYSFKDHPLWLIPPTLTI